MNFVQLSRFTRIVRVMVRHGLDEFVTFAPALKVLASFVRLFTSRGDRTLPRGQRVREALEELGPVFVKFGQLLSTRPDLIPEDIATELVKLQDKVPPFSSDVARSVIEAAYGNTIEGHFQSFENDPIASASVAQVHLAELHDGSEVVVKVLRPGIEKTINHDLELLYAMASLAERYWSQGPRLRPVDIVEDYDETIHDELDLMREAANASQLRSNFEHSDLVYVPKVYWDHTQRGVLVMERIHGIPIRDIDVIKAAGIDMRKLAHDGVEIFFTQAFRDGFFHADMHPGNIFISDTGQYRAVDFGIVGTLGETDKRYLATMFLGFFNRDYHEVAAAHLRAGWVPPETRVEEFEAAIRTVCEPIFARPISEISFGKFVVRLFQTARRFNMPIQPQLVLLQKTLLQIEGLGRQLYPQLDLWDTAKPYLERWMSEQVGPRAAAKALRRELPKLATLAPEIPELTHSLLRRLRDDDLVVKTQSREVEQLRRQLKSSHRRLFFGIVGCTALLSAAIIAALDGRAPTIIYDGPLISWMLAALGLTILIFIWPSSKDD